MRFLIPLFFVISCQWAEDRYARRLVSPQEVGGTWIATDYALKSFKDVGVKDHLSRIEHVLTFHPDGTCAAKTFFSLPPGQDGDADYRSYESGCTWKLSGKLPQQTVWLTFAGETSVPKALFFYFAEEDGKLIIWNYAIDPDAWRYTEFERRPPN